MFYYLAELRNLWGGFNVFTYITFRTGGATLSTLFLTLAIAPTVIAELKSRKIRETQKTFGPPSHGPKAGTPTMGGIMIFVGIIANTLLWARWDNRFIWLLLFATVGLAVIGMWDDYMKLHQKGALGASSRTKFAVQIFVATVIVGYLAIEPPNGAFATHLSIPYLKERMFDAGPWYFVLGILMIVGASNAVNLTDGLDGLASGSVIFCALTYLIFAYAAGHARFSTYLKLVPVEGAGEICVYLGSMIGACLAFLWYNAYPAEVFMGDTSSLFLGGVIATVALCVKQELILPVVGGVFVLETLSVIIQMGSFKLFKGKRVFKMAPIHHHFEMSGIAEPKVTVRFWIFAIVMMLVALASLKIR